MAVNNNITPRFWTAVLLFLGLCGIALLALLVGAGELDRSHGFVVLLFSILLLLSLTLAFVLPLSCAKSVAIHSILVLGSLVFMFPFAWLIITSFKYPEEVVSYPPTWIPAVPRPLAQSPYVTAEAYDPVLPPPEITDARWQRLEPRITDTLWERSAVHLDAAHYDGLNTDLLREAIVQGVWHTLMAGTPAAVWQQNDDALLDALARRVTKDRLEDVWSAIYRCVAVREPFVTNMERLDFPITGLSLAHLEDEATPTDNIVLRQQPISLAASDFMTVLAYDLDHNPEAQFQLELPLPMETSELLSVTLPLRQDRTWHRLRFVLEVDGQRYESQDPLFSGGYRWQELTFKLADRDATDERDVGIWPLKPVLNTPDAYDNPGHIRISLVIQRSSRLAALWNKYVQNYRNAWIAGEHWDRYIANSMYLVLMNVIGQIISCSMVAYAFARLRWPGRDVVFLAVLATLMLPPQVTMVPLFLVFRTLGWYNTLRPLWVPAFFAGGAFFIFLLRQFMKGIPRELEEAALIDGCGYFGIYSRIILPLIKPALAAVGIFTFMGAWNEFMGPLIYLNDQRLYPLALGLFNFRDEYGGDFGMLMAASTIMILPVVVIFFFAQKYFIQGVTLTGMKN